MFRWTKFEKDTGQSSSRLCRIAISESDTMVTSGSRGLGQCVLGLMAGMCEVMVTSCIHSVDDLEESLAIARGRTLASIPSCLLRFIP